MRVVAVVQARIKSERLPGKVIMDIAGQPTIWRIYKRLQWTQGVSAVCLAVPTADLDLFTPVAFRYGMNLTNGPEQDLLTRILWAASAYQADAVVVIGADCPLVCPQVVANVIHGFLTQNGVVNFASNCIERTFPDGLDCELYTTALLCALDQRLRGADREWFGQWCRENIEHKLRLSVTLTEDLSGERWTLDYPEDHAFIEKVYEDMGRDVFTMKDVRQLLKEKPRLRNINAMHRGKGFGGRPI